MQVIFYYNVSDARVVNKELQNGKTFEGVMRDEVNIMNPFVMFDSPEVMRYNYCYIPDLQRYYAVNSVNILRDQLYEVSMSVDVLMSFRSDIYKLSAIVDKQTDEDNGDEYIDDSSLVTDNLMFSKVYPFTKGFNDTPEYILITAG